MKKVHVWFLVFILILIPVNIDAETTTKVVSFARCVDGDTAVFIVDDEEVKFRFLAIDTPETVHPTKEEEAYGKQASEYTCNLLTNAKEILIEYENNNKKDKYGRDLAWIWVDQKLLQDELIKKGYGKVAYIYGNYRYTLSLCMDERKAQEENLGIWNVQKAQETYCYTQDLALVDYNINYQNVNNIDDDKKEEDISSKLEQTADKLEETLNTLEENLETKYGVYIIMGLAIISIIVKSIKNK